jgi:hypothetical protein
MKEDPPALIRSDIPDSGDSGAVRLQSGCSSGRRRQLGGAEEGSCAVTAVMALRPDDERGRVILDELEQRTKVRPEQVVDDGAATTSTTTTLTSTPSTRYSTASTRGGATPSRTGATCSAARRALPTDSRRRGRSSETAGPPLSFLGVDDRRPRRGSAAGAPSEVRLLRRRLRHPQQPPMIGWVPLY